MHQAPRLAPRRARLVPALAALALAWAAAPAAASAPPAHWVEAGGPGLLMQYYVDADTVRREGAITYYRLHGRGVRSESRQTQMEAEVGVDCRLMHRSEFISTTRWQDGVRTTTGTGYEPVPVGGRHATEVQTACRLAERPASERTAVASAASAVASTAIAGASAALPLPPAVAMRQDVNVGAGGRMRWSATGFAVGREVVVTNHHVVQGCNNIQVQQGGVTLPARLLASDQGTDLAALAVPGASLPALQLAEERPELGEAITVLGYPLAHVLGSDLRVTTGIVSSLSGVGGEDGTMQISAAVQSGNSGGPVLDPTGAVAGVVVKKLDTRFGAENVGFAVRLAALRKFLSASGVAYRSTREAQRAQAVTVAQVVRKTAPSVMMVSCA